jgi:hypothetical protein
MIDPEETEDGSYETLRKQLKAAMQRCERLQQQCEEHRLREGHLEERLGSMRREMAMSRRRFDTPNAWEPGLGELFNRIAGEILEGGWDQAYDRWVGSFDKSTTQSSGSGGDGNITVIPGTGGACTETVLVFLKSRDWPHGFHPRHHGQEMDTLRIHLVECQKVRRVLIISDTIHMPSFDDEYLRWIRAWSARGVAFAHALVAPDRRTLLPIPLGI